MKRFSAIISLALVCLFCLSAFSAAGSAEEGFNPLLVFQTGLSHRVTSAGHYVNWAGVSTVSQFTDEAGRFCFAVDGESEFTVVRTDKGSVTEQLTISKKHPLLGAVICDGEGNLYAVYGENDSETEAGNDTVFIVKYSSAGVELAEVGDNGYFYDGSFATRNPFDAGNCDAAISGNLLMVNYAREMYNGHQSNSLFTVDLTTMTKKSNFTFYNSHSFDQRVTPYSKTGGFLLESHGDCYPRAFNTAYTDASRVCKTMETFHFWVQEGAYDNFNMYQLNRTYALLGNILETSSGAMLVGASARSLSESAINEPYDLFVQVFDPAGSASDPSTCVTVGERSGKAGTNGDEQVTDYGVCWLTDLSSDETTVNKVQAVSVDGDTVVVLYELYKNSAFLSTNYLVLDGSGQIKKAPAVLNDARLNLDEDPVWAQNAVQWVQNKSGENTLSVYSLFLSESDRDAFAGAAPLIPGDINSDGFVTIEDVTALLNALSSGTASQICDLDNSGNVSIEDVTSLLNLLAGTLPGV